MIMAYSTSRLGNKGCFHKGSRKIVPLTDTSLLPSFSPPACAECRYCLRLLFFCLTFAVTVIMAVVEKYIASRALSDTYEADGEFAIASDFSSSCSGIIFLVIFGSTKDAVKSMRYFLTCGCIRKRMTCFQLKDESRALRLESATSSMGRPPSSGGPCTGRPKCDSIGIDLESALSMPTSLSLHGRISATAILPATTTPAPTLSPSYSPATLQMQQTMTPTLSPALGPIVSPYLIHPHDVLVIPFPIYNPADHRHE